MITAGVKWLRTRNLAVAIEAEATDLPIRHALSQADEPPEALTGFCRQIACQTSSRSQAVLP
jgi:hypothetical protein